MSFLLILKNRLLDKQWAQIEELNKKTPNIHQLQSQESWKRWDLLLHQGRTWEMIPLRMTSMPTAIWSAEYGQSSGGTWINWNSREQGLLTCSAVAFSFDLRQNQFKIFSLPLFQPKPTPTHAQVQFELYFGLSQIKFAESRSEPNGSTIAFQKLLVKFNAAKTKSTNFDESLSSSSSNAGRKIW